MKGGVALLEATLLLLWEVRGWGVGDDNIFFLFVREFLACTNTCKYVPTLPTPLPPTLIKDIGKI